MWFGDLVTMEWWNDLWLNESFATFTSILCQADAADSRWPQAWTTFANSMKTWAYRQDQLPSTHPIMAEINDLEDVQVNFDGITYAKGASVLKQLVAYVGTDEFFAGVQAYMKRHAWGNTRLSDLLGALEETSGRDLKAWSKAWLETAGINVLRPEIEVDDDGVMTSLAVRQEAPALPAGAKGEAVLRPHRIAIGMYDLDADGALVRTERIELDVDGELTDVPVPTGRRRPAVVLLNDDDLSYAKVRLDAESLANVTAHHRRLHRVAAARPVLGLGLGHDPRRRARGPRLPGTGAQRHRPGVRHRRGPVAAPGRSSWPSTSTPTRPGVPRA